MSKRKITNNLDQTAFNAWKKLFPDSPEPRHVDILKQQNRSNIYRLVGIGPKRSNVVAKRREYDKAMVESIIYSEVLPKINMKTLYYYGFVEEQTEAGGRQFAWLFLNDFGDWNYSTYSRKQHTLLAKWLGEFHVASSDLEKIKNNLPERSAEYHNKRFLQNALDLIPRVLTEHILEKEERILLENILRKFEVLSKLWNDIVIFCKQVPNTVIHGDCLPKNIYFQKEGDEFLAIPFDWSAAAWGPIGLDLGQTALPYRNIWPEEPNIDEYYSQVKIKWPDIQLKTVQQLSHLGQLFWAIDVISWAIPEYDYEWVKKEKLLTNLKIYLKVLEKAMNVTGYNERYKK